MTQPADQPGAVVRAGQQEAPRTTVRRLMRGTLREGVIGEHGLTAVLEACREHEITDADAALALIAYAYGYAQGLHCGLLDRGGCCDAHATLMREGYADGLAVDVLVSFPAPVTP